MFGSNLGLKFKPGLQPNYLKPKISCFCLLVCHWGLFFARFLYSLPPYSHVL